MRTKLTSVGVVSLLVVAMFAMAAWATTSEIYLSSDKNGQSRVTNVHEGDEVFIAVYDPDENIDCDVRDKIWTDVKLFDPKTGAYIEWTIGEDGDFSADYLEETGADTGLFVSKRSFKIGSRVDWDDPANHGHTDQPDFTDGGLLYVAGEQTVIEDGEILGRIENMDTLVAFYLDPNDESDVAVSMAKVTDTEATITWGQEVYKDANGSAMITVVDPDENLNGNEVEWVPVFILVNPGSWNPVQPDGPTTFPALKQTGGVDETTGASFVDDHIHWHNIYQQDANPSGLYYVQYEAGTYFDTVDPDGITPVLFYAQETGVNTGVFQLNINSLLVDLEFNALRVRDVLVAYYLDPNDEDDFKLATAYIEERQHSITTFTDATRSVQDLYWIGRDSVYVQVIDANANVEACCPEQVAVHVYDVHEEDDVEWLVLDETSSNSPVFFSNAGTQLDPVWDAVGVGITPPTTGGYQLQLDNWKLEVFNEDEVVVRYNDVYYELGADGLGGLGDIDTGTAFPPVIDRIRVANDLSFDIMSIGDTQVYDGTSVNMFFLDRQGNPVSGFVNSDGVYIGVIDPDQDEDQGRRERIDGFWDAGQNWWFGPQDLNEFGPDYDRAELHGFNALLGDTNIFNNGGDPKIFVLNPRSGRWAAVDLLETGVATGEFISVVCIDLASVYSAVPTLGVIPGDTIIAVYQDPSNHSDSAWISIKVGIGGGGTPPSQASTTMFVDMLGNEVANYTDADEIFVKVIDPSHAGATLLADAVEIGGITFDLTPLTGAQNDTFITAALSLGVSGGDQLTATYTDPTDPTDVGTDTITIIASVLQVDAFYAGPSPFDTEAAFGYSGTGVASVMSVEVYDLAGRKVWTQELANVTEIVWDGTDSSGTRLANGAYIYVIMATDGTDSFNGEGTVFIAR